MRQSWAELELGSGKACQHKKAFMECIVINNTLRFLVYNFFPNDNTWCEISYWSNKIFELIFCGQKNSMILKKI